MNKETISKIEEHNVFFYDQNSHLVIVQCNFHRSRGGHKIQNIFIRLPPTALPPFSGRWEGCSFDSGQYLIVCALSPFAEHKGHVYARRIGHTTLPSGVFSTWEPYTSSGAPLFRQKTQIFGSCFPRLDAGFRIFRSTLKRSKPWKAPPKPTSRSGPPPPPRCFWKGLRMEKRSFKSRIEAGGGGLAEGQQWQQQQQSMCPFSATHWQGAGESSSKPSVAFRDSVIELGFCGSLFVLVTRVVSPR